MPTIVRKGKHWARWYRAYHRPVYPRSVSRAHPLSGSADIVFAQTAPTLLTAPRLSGSPAAIVFAQTAPTLTTAPRLSGSVAAITFATVAADLSVSINDHWLNIRDGDILPIFAPFAGRVGFCGYVRVTARTYREDTDELVELETQWVEPVTIATPLRFISEGGAIAPPVVAQVSQVAEQLTAVSKEQAAQGIRLDGIEEENKNAIPKGRLVDNVVGAINDSGGGISGDKIDNGTLGAVTVPAVRLSGAVVTDASNNVKLAAATDVASGQGVIGIKNATSNPSGSPSGGGVMYADAGALKWLGSSGTITTLGPADPHCPVCGRDFALEFVNGPTGDRLAVCLWCLTDALGNAGVIEKVTDDPLAGLGWGAQPVERNSST